MNLISVFAPSNLPAAVRRQSPLAVQREIILQSLLNAVTGFAMLGMLLYLARTPINLSNLALITAFVAAIAFLLLVTLSRRWPYRLRAPLLTGLVVSACLASLSSQGLNGSALVYAVAMIAVPTALFSARAGIASLIAVTLVYAIYGWLDFTGILPPRAAPLTSLPAQVSAWINLLLAYLLTAVAVIGAFQQLTAGLLGALSEQTSLAEQLIAERALLESRVAQRTGELARRADLLEAARQVSNAIASETDLEKLLTTAAERIKLVFNVAQTAIYLANPKSGAAELRASSGSVETGIPQPAPAFRLDESGPLSRAMMAGETLYENIGAGRLLAPMKSGDQAVGLVVLTASQTNPLDLQDAAIYTTTVDQLALSIGKALLVKQLEDSLKSTEENFRQATQKSWEFHLKTTRKRYAYRYIHSTTIQGAIVHPASEQALNSGAIVQSTCADQTGQPSALLAVPIKLHGQTLGVFNIRVSGAQISPELSELVENTVNRLAISLENARLLENIQNRAERERLVGEIASKVRSATDVESILRTTAAELGRSLGVTEVIVQLNKPQ